MDDKSFGKINKVKAIPDLYDKYVVISRFTWGCTPIDIDWAINCKLFEEMEVKLITLGIVNKLPIIEKLIK